MPNEPVKKNLYQRLVDVKRALGGTIEKGGTAPPVMGGFAFIEWDDVAEKVGLLFAEHGVEFLPSITESDIFVCGQTGGEKPKDMFRATVTVSIELINIDEPTDTKVVSWRGEGDDVGDKSVQKAATSALKYWLIRKFLLGGVAGAVDSDGVSPDGGTTSAPTGERNEAPKNGLCEQCAQAQYKSKRGYPPRYWANDRAGSGFQCDGVDPGGNYQNHQPKVTPRPGSAARPDEVLSEAERQDQERQAAPAVPVAAGSGEGQGTGSSPQPSLFDHTIETMKALPIGWPAKMADVLVSQEGMTELNKGMTPVALRSLPEDKLKFVRDWAVTLKGEEAKGRDPWSGVDPDSVPF